MSKLTWEKENQNLLQAKPNTLTVYVASKYMPMLVPHGEAPRDCGYNWFCYFAGRCIAWGEGLPSLAAAVDMCESHYAETVESIRYQDFRESVCRALCIVTDCEERHVFEEIAKLRGFFDTIMGEVVKNIPENDD